jgi:hypothetical protein
MRRTFSLLALVLISFGTVHAQWQLQTSNTTADLRGIHSIGNGVAWASGTNGTVLRTEDGGYVWQSCSIPPNAEHLDFRGIQAFDANTAIVMSSGKGDLSRLYKTNDGCHSWKLLFTNPDSEGFWDAIAVAQVPTGKTEPLTRLNGVVVGDPVDGTFPEFISHDTDHWTKYTGLEAGLPAARQGEGLFAASNSSVLFLGGGQLLFVTGGSPGSRSRLLSEYVKHDPYVSWKYVGGDLPLASGQSAGAFSVATSYSYVPRSLSEELANPPKEGPRVYFFPANAVCVAVGGDFKKPSKSSGTAAFSLDGGLHWRKTQTPPHGYRSSVAYDQQTKTWIAAGPNGSDISTDDGKNWRPLHPNPAQHDAPDADKNWNALSLPFVVGPKGRIGKLNPAALPH